MHLIMSFFCKACVAISCHKAHAIAVTRGQMSWLNSELQIIRNKEGRFCMLFYNIYFNVNNRNVLQKIKELPS